MSWLLIFLRKSWTEKKRHVFRNSFNTFVPILFIVVIVCTQQHARPKQKDGSLESAIDQDDLVDYLPGELVNKIYYTPQTALTEALMENVRQKLYMHDERIVPYSSESELEYELLENEFICYGIIFNNVTDEGRLRYTIRTKNNNFRTKATYSRNVFYTYKQRDNEYVKSGFLALQNAVDRAFMKHLTKEEYQGKSKPRHISLRYGHIPVDESRGPDEPSRAYTVIAVVLACFAFGIIYLLLLPLVEERACGMKEHLKIACLASYWNDVSIFLITFIHFFFIFVVCLSISLLAGVWDYNLSLTIFLFLVGVLFLFNLISFIFLLSTTLESSTMAIAVAPASLYIPFMLAQFVPDLHFCFCLFPVQAFFTAGTIFVSYKSSGHQFGALDMFNTDYPSLDNLSLFQVCLMLLLGTILWTFLWFYNTNVFPGRYGTPKPKGFFLSKKYWRGVWTLLTGSSGKRHSNKVMAESRHRLQQQNTNVCAPEDSVDANSLEIAIPDINEAGTVPKASLPLVRISNLTKVFKGQCSGTRAKVAVKDFSISIYNHNITVLLGHNGAGKTTTMNIITGIVPRTSGTILVDGEDDPNRYRQKIGFCPQHNVFFSYLTCLEHLEFFGRLRGLGDAEASKQAKVVLEKVNLVDKRENFVNTLSGGMKRRLSLASAIIGHTKLLILDEPTSGLDPESRRDIWDLLLKLRKDHTILLTTHFMEEADILGDWIAIMEYGELVAFGTPIFLKHIYGKGYTLKLQKLAHFDEATTLQIVRQHVPGAVVRESVFEVYAVTLPYDSFSEYSSLLKNLEENHQELGIDTMSMTNATLEEVFLNSSKANKVVQHHQESEERDHSPLRSPPTLQTAVERSYNVKWQAALHICLAIWRKKTIHINCYKHIYGSIFLLPLTVTVLCFSLTTGNADVAIALPAVTLNSLNIRRALGVIVINRNPNNEAMYPLFSKETILSEASSVSGGMQFIMPMDNISLTDALEELLLKDYTEYRDRVVFGIECNISMDSVEMTVLYNNNLVHSTGIAETVAATLLLRNYFGLPNALVEVQNIPSTRKLLIDTGTPYYFTELISFAFMVYILLFLQVPLQEHQTGFRQLQNINRYVYWFSTFLFDFLIHFLMCALVVGLAKCMDTNNVFSSVAYTQIFGALVLYGMLALLVVYIVSQCVDNSNTAITIMSYLMIVGVAGVFLVSNGYDDIQNNSFAIAVLHIIPEFGFKHTMRVIYENQKLTVYDSLSKIPTDHSKEQLSVGQFYIVALITFPVLALILNEVVENIYKRERIANVKRFLRLYIDEANRIVCNSMRPKTQYSENHELTETSSKGFDEVDGATIENIQRETDTVDKLLGDESSQDERNKYAIVVKKLQKAYCAHDAVSCISFAVKKGECFGLLGMNGAGKTTVFQMVSRNIPVSAGEIYLEHCEVQKANAIEYRQQFGYCPQVDMLLDFLTVYATIDYFALLKNIPSREDHIIYWLTVLDLLAYRDCIISECSGGTKRKVNTILALLGGPSVLLLDEPTTGVDPKSRRFLWRCLKSIQRDDQAILLTSHSMDECEELCNRLSIMVDGRLRCIGSILQLKKCHGKGYNLLLKLNSTFVAEAEENYCESLISEVERRFEASLLEQHQDMLKFAVNQTVTLSELFKRVHELIVARAQAIASYSVNESSLEDIFLQFRPKTRRN